MRTNARIPKRVNTAACSAPDEAMKSRWPTGGTSAAIVAPCHHRSAILRGLVWKNLSHSVVRGARPSNSDTPSGEQGKRQKRGEVKRTGEKLMGRGSQGRESVQVIFSGTLQSAQSSYSSCPPASIRQSPPTYPDSARVSSTASRITRSASRASARVRARAPGWNRG